MTSLIDVIFLLLLFFMLTSTFSKFAEVELTSAASGTAPAADTPPLFLQLGAESLRLNGDALELATLSASQLADAPEGTVVLVSLGTTVNAQRLTDLLVALRALPALQISVLGS
jgi:biopolymer transport protein ExbD